MRTISAADMMQIIYRIEKAEAFIRALPFGVGINPFDLGSASAGLTTARAQLFVATCCDVAVEPVELKEAA